LFIFSYFYSYSQNLRVSNRNVIIFKLAQIFLLGILVVKLQVDIRARHDAIHRIAPILAKNIASQILETSHASHRKGAMYRNRNFKIIWISAFEIFNFSIGKMLSHHKFFACGARLFILFIHFFYRIWTISPKL